MRKGVLIMAFLSLSAVVRASDSTTHKGLELLSTISGKLSPKSIVHNGNGLFFAQNMMYRHTISVFDRNFELVKTIKDKIKLSHYISDTSFHSDAYHRGAPVECVFTDNGNTAWVSNYEMFGKGFEHPGCDHCHSKDKYDKSFVYKINTQTLKIDTIIEVGSVPKFMAATNNNNLVLVSNWTSGDVSIINTKINSEVKRIKVGRFPRGIAIDNKKNIAYVAIMGGSTIATINLNTFEKTYIEVGEHPRHLCLDETENILYATLNGEGKVAKINLNNHSIEKLKTGRLPRSMSYSAQNKTLYVVNYGNHFLSKVDAVNFKVVDTIKTNSKPIGVTIDESSGQIWVACYSGSIMVFKDHNFAAPLNMGPFLADNNIFYSPSAVKEKKAEKKKEEIDEVKAVIKPPIIKSKKTENYYIIVGSFREKPNAIKLSKSSSELHYFTHNNGKHYVYQFNSTSKEKSQHQLNLLKEKNPSFNGWILKY